MRPPRVPPQPVARSIAWPVGLLVALCFTTLPLFLALSPGRPTLFDVWQQMGIKVTVHYGTRTCASRYAAFAKCAQQFVFAYLLSRRRRDEAVGAFELPAG
jgi:hypothetical protein